MMTVPWSSAGWICPRSSCSARMGGYSYPWLPAISASTGPGCAPWKVVTGIPVPASMPAGISMVRDSIASAMITSVYHQLTAGLKFDTIRLDTINKATGYEQLSRHHPPFVFQGRSRIGSAGLHPQPDVCSAQQHGAAGQLLVRRYGLSHLGWHRDASQGQTGLRGGAGSGAHGPQEEIPGRHGLRGL